VVKTRTEQDWHNVYNVLVEKGGASERMREAFVSHCVAGELTEWRFEGHLGFGGKIWLERHTGRLDINCYVENNNAKTEKIIAEINALLANL
jgi:hypothetical protein